MKTVRCLALSLVFGGGAMVRAGADSGQGSSPTLFSQDPDAVPRAFAEPARRPSSQRPEDKAQNPDWLVHGYEQQMEAHAAAQNRDGNLYAHLAEDKDLAKLAGLSNVDLSTQPAADLHASGNQPALSLRPDAPSDTPAPAPKMTGFSFKPLITPLSEAQTAGLPNFYASLSVKAATDPAPAPAVDAAPEPAPDPGAMDVPGLTAAESDPNAKGNLDPSLDLLPGESPAEAHPPHDLTLELPPSSNAERIQQQQNVALMAPGQKPKTIAPVPINPRLLTPVDDTAAMVPDPSPVRGQVDDPNDVWR